MLAPYARIHRTLLQAALAVWATGAFGTPASPGADPATVQDQVEPPTEAAGSGRNFVVAPIPISNPSVGTGLALTGMILYKMDADSPESSTDLGGGYLSSHSWLVGAGEKLNFDHDLYRLNAALGFGQINYNFYGIGADSSSTGLPLEQKVF